MLIDIGAFLLACSAKSTMSPALTVSAVYAVFAVPGVPALFVLIFLSGCLLLGSKLYSLALHGEGCELLECLAALMHRTTQSLANVMADEAAWVSALRPLVSPYCVSSSTSPPALQATISLHLSSPLASIRLTATSAHARASDTLLLAEEN